MSTTAGATVLNTAQPPAENTAMPEFRYEATDPRGTEVTATMFGVDPDWVITELNARGYEVHRVEEVEEEPATSERRVPSSPRHSSPPPAPRDVPRVGFSLANPGTFAIGFGALFGGIGLLVAAGNFISAGPFTFGALFGGVFGLIGGSAFVAGVRNRSRRRWVLEHGAVAEAVITGTGLDATMRVNGRNPYKMAYDFRTAAGAEVEGFVRTFDEEITGYMPGEPIWVVYNPDRPRQNAVWPPL